MLLYNNRWICLLPFARKPDPGRVSKQVSRCRAAAGLALWPGSFGAAGRTKSAAGKPIQRAAGRKKYAICCDPLLFSLGFRSRCSRRAAPPAARCSQRRTAERGRKVLCRSSVLFFLFFREAGPKCKTGAGGADPPPPKQQVIRSGARWRPFLGGAGRRPPCPNGALLEKNGRVARREGAAGASRWGLGSKNRPSS